MTFTETQKTYLRRLEKKMKKDFKTTSYRKVFFFFSTLINPHSTLCGYPFRANFRKNIFKFTIRYRDRGACLKSVGGGGGRIARELFHQAGWILSGNFLLSTEKIIHPRSLRYINREFGNLERQRQRQRGNIIAYIVVFEPKYTLLRLICLCKYSCFFQTYP